MALTSGDGHDRGADAVEAFRRARRTFLAGERIEMRNLAAELEIDRVTLFRWLGNREQLVADVVWSIAEPTLRAAERDVASIVPIERPAHILRVFMVATIGNVAFQSYLVRDRDRALRVLTSSRTNFQSRLTDYVEQLIRRYYAPATGADLPDRDLAFTVVRIMEAFVYTDLITGSPPDAKKGAAAIGALFKTRTFQPLGQPGT